MRNGGAPIKGTPPSSYLKDSLPPAEQIASSVRRGTRPFGLRSFVRYRYFCLRVFLPIPFGAAWAVSPDAIIRTYSVYYQYTGCLRPLQGGIASDLPSILTIRPYWQGQFIYFLYFCSIR